MGGGSGNLTKMGNYGIDLCPLQGVHLRRFTISTLSLVLTSRETDVQTAADSVLAFICFTVLLVQRLECHSVSFDYVSSCFHKHPTSPQT